MTDSIRQLVRRAPAFIAVGVAHLPGEEGLLQLLRKEGFGVELVPATFTGLAEKYEASPVLRTLDSFQSE